MCDCVCVYWEAQVLWSLRKSGLVDIILYMVSSEQEESYYMYLLEILSLMLREHRPADLANVAITRSQSEKTQDEAEFLAVRRQEMDRKNERIRSFTSARYVLLIIHSLPFHLHLPDTTPARFVYKFLSNRF